jgi:hypothetical protein
MRMYNGVDSDMVTDYVGNVLPKYCPYCGGRCWGIKEYPYACRCSDCSAYFHRSFLTCDDLEREGYDIHLCTECHNSPALRIFEMDDDRLVEVCQGCAKWLCEEGYVSSELEISNGDDDFVDSAFGNPDGSVRV